MPTNHEQLETLNLEIAERENVGDTAYFQELLAPAFALRRARTENPFTSRDEFLTQVAGGGQRTTTDVEVQSIAPGTAVVTCLVHVPLPEGTVLHVHNVRLFTRNPDNDQWLLLGWVNEAAPDTTG